MYTDELFDDNEWDARRLHTVGLWNLRNSIFGPLKWRSD